MPTTRFLSFLPLVLVLAACGSKPAEDAATTKPKDAAAAKDGKDTPAAPEAAEAPTEDPTAGYEGHLLAALETLAAGGPVAKAETAPYGCSVKYGDDGGGVEAQAKVGAPAPAFTLTDTDGQSVALESFKGKTVVLEWFNPDCPFVKYAHGEGPLASLANEQTKAGIVWLAINSGAPGNQGAGAERNAEAKAEWKLDHPVLIDEDGAVGHLYGATTTPHMFVVDPSGTLVYAGGLDNAPLGRIEG